ncbi:phosphoadenosine phosphosulfate reductase family protein, partial [Paenibacillus sp. EKM208P]
MNLLEKEALIRVKAIELEEATPEEIIQYAVLTFPNLTFACSFGAEDVVLVDMLQKISPSTDIFYLDTDFHFQETYDTRDQMKARYNLDFVRV